MTGKFFKRYERMPWLTITPLFPLSWSEVIFLFLSVLGITVKKKPGSHKKARNLCNCTNTYKSMAIMQLCLVIGPSNSCFDTDKACWSCCRCLVSDFKFFNSDCKTQPLAIPIFSKLNGGKIATVRAARSDGNRSQGRGEKKV